MTLSDKAAYRQFIGGIMHNTLLLVEYTDINPQDDFDNKVARYCYIIINNLYVEGATKLTPEEVDQEFLKLENSAATQYYIKNGGLDFLKESYYSTDIDNFDLYYKRIKKYSLLRRLIKEGYDVSNYYADNNDLLNNPLLNERQLQANFDAASLEEILNAVESKYDQIRSDYLNGGKKKGDPGEGIFELIETLKTTPDMGPELEGKIFSSACRGAREGCLFLKSASTSAGKSRTSIFDACRIAFPIRWSHQAKTFINEYTLDGEQRLPRTVLFIVTEMDKTELQSIMLAYLSGVDEDHILRGRYDFGEEARVLYAANIITQFHEYFIIEEISDPNLTNVEATVKKYVTMDNVKYIWFDYIHTTASLVGQFAANNLREDVVLMMMANQLKQLAKDYGVFIFTATQVNAGGMDDDGGFKNEMNIRGSKAVADKVDAGFVMTRVTEKMWNSMIPKLKTAVNQHIISSDIINFADLRPTHVLDIYKMRRGRYKNVRIWTRLHLGTGERLDLFMTTADNELISTPIDTYNTMIEEPIADWERIVGEVVAAN